MYAKKRELNRSDSKAEFKDVPRMSQVGQAPHIYSNGCNLLTTYLTVIYRYVHFSLPEQNLSALPHLLGKISKQA